MLRSATALQRLGVRAGRYAQAPIARRSMGTLFTKQHEWVRFDAPAAGDVKAGEIVTVGVTDHAQHELGDVVYVDLPAVDAESPVAAGEALVAVESVKAASDVYAPVTGSVVEVNGALVDNPILVNTGAESEGWMVKLKLEDPSQFSSLLDETAYKAFVENETH